MRPTKNRIAIMYMLAILILFFVPWKKASGQLLAANESQTASKPALAPASPAAPKATLADLAWLIGRWQGVWGPRVAQQIWMPPKAGVMLGTLQIAENEQTQVIELFSLSESADGIEYRLRHFTPALAAWEKSAPAVLRLTTFNPKTIIFENPGDDQPKRTTITLLDADTYVSRSEIDPGQGDPQITEIVYHRQKEAPIPHH